MKKSVVIGVIFVLAVIAALVYSTMNLAKYRVEVCMEFRGATSCRTASGSEKSVALRTATTNACAMIASGVTDSIACEQSEPKRITWLK